MSDAQQAQQPKVTKPTNPFRHDAPTRPVQHHAASHGSLSVRRTGLIPLCIGASRMVPGRDGSRRQYEARELRVEAERALRDGRQLSVTCLCFECREMYASFEDFSAAHPWSVADMAANEEAHTWAFWCEDKADPKGTETAEALASELKALTAAHRACVKGIAGLADVEAIMKERARATEITKMIDETAKLKKIAEESIIGLMSETPYPA